MPGSLNRSADLRLRGPRQPRARLWRSTWTLASLGVVVLAAFGAALAQAQAQAQPAQDWTGAAGMPGDRLFHLTNVLTVHLRFTPDQWEAMEPVGGPGPFSRGGGPGNRGGPPGDFGPGGPPGPGGPGGFGPAMFLAPLILSQGDTNHDGRLARPEFAALAGKWFAAWDTNRTGRLDMDKVRGGLNATMAAGGDVLIGGPMNRGGGPGAARRGGPGGGMGGPPLLGAEGKRNGLASAMGIEFNYVHADLEVDGELFRDVAVRYKGNGTFLESRGTLKRSLKVNLNRYGKSRKLGGVTKLDLHNNVTDASWMNEVLSHRLFRDAGVPAPRSAYARVHLTVPGQHEHRYLGLYSLVENVDNDFAEARYGTRKGAIFKPVMRQLFDDLGGQWAAYRQSYDPKTPVSDEECQRVIGLCKLVSHASDAEFAARLQEYLDLDEFARFLAVTVWLSTMDSILQVGQNFLVYLHPKTRQFQFIPWDLDHSFGQFPMSGSQEMRENLSILRPWNGPNRFLERVFQVEAFKSRYLATMLEFSRTLFRPERLHQQVDALAAAIRPAVQEESEEKLRRFDRVVAGESVERAGFGGGARFGPPGGFGQAPKPIKGFVTARAQSVAEQLAGKSTGMTMDRSGFGPPGGPRGPGIPGGPPGGPPGPGAFGPGNFLGPVLLKALDADGDGVVTRNEFVLGFDHWFAAWNTDQSGVLTDEQLRAGINQDLAPFRGGGPPPFDPP
jgi:hypothetical protein